MRIFFLGDITEKRRSTILASFQNLWPGIKTSKKDELTILGSPLCPKSRADLLEQKINEREKVIGTVGKLDAHYGFFVEKLLQSAKVVFFLRTSARFNHSVLLEKNDKTVRNGLSKKITWTSTKFRGLSWLCPLRWVVLGFHPHHY